jgi:hypothetical protein
MGEFTLDDGRKAEKLEKTVDSLTKVTEVYVEPKAQKKLSQRITEKLCVCERHIETLDEVTGEVIDLVVEKVCGETSEKVAAARSPMQVLVEEKIKKKEVDVVTYVLLGVMASLLAGLTYVVVFM